MPTKRSLNRQLADARAQVRRLIDERDTATSTAGTGQFSTRYLARQLSEARDEIDHLTRKLTDQQPEPPAPDAWKRERARWRQRLDLSERARASLDTQILQLGQANERLNREAYERAEAAR